MADADLQRTIATEIRTCALFSEPPDRMPPPRDLDAERRILSAMREHPVDVRPRWFGYAFHEALAVALAACWEKGYEPTTDRLVVLVEAIGIDPVRLREHIEGVTDCEPYPHHLADDIATVRELARRRGMLRAIEVADTLLRTTASEAHVVDRAIERIVEACNAD